jgi:hypothetical protein
MIELHQLEISHVPQELKELSQWVNWRLEARDGKTTKVPINSRNNSNASCTDRLTWSDFVTALQKLHAGEADGVGFEITPLYVGIDLDKCRKPETGQIEQWAQDIISELNSYTELSPSQTGVHIWVKGELPAGGRHKGHIEMYDRSRFFTITGDHVDNTPLTIEERTPQLRVLHERIFASNQQTTTVTQVQCEAPQIFVPSRPIDRVIAGLENVHNGGQAGEWSARCPAHDDACNSLSVAEDATGKVLLHCHAGCDLQKIVGALSLTVSDLFPAFSLAEYAHAKKLPLAFLIDLGLKDSKSGIEIPYFDEARTSVLAKRYRFSMTGLDRFRWKKNDQPCPYGLWRLAEARALGFIVLVEGESDCHTLWHHHIPALGVPGAASWRNEWSDFMKDIPVIYAVVEPDNGGETFRLQLLETSVIRDRLRLVRLNDAKDPSGLYVKDPEGFVVALQATLSSAALPPEINGADLLRSLEDYFTRYAALEKGLPLLSALWSVATHLFNEFDVFPYLAITSPTKGCGKTRLGELLEFVCANAERMVGITPGPLYRMVDKNKPTLIIDEAESLSGKSDSAVALRPILNAGYRKGGKVPRCAGKDENYDPKMYNTFCPKVLILIGSLTDTLSDRCIPIGMKRRTNEKLTRFRFATVQKETAQLKTDMAQWAAANKTHVSDYYQTNDVLFVNDREAELWNSLFAVLAVADPSRLAELEVTARHLSNAKSSTESTDLGIRLLSDVRQIFSGPHGTAEHLSSEALSKSLKAIEESPWKDLGFGKELTLRKLADFLRPYGIATQNVRVEGTKVKSRVIKAYKKEVFKDAWERYLSQEATATAPSIATNHLDQGQADASASATAITPVNKTDSEPAPAIKTGVLNEPVALVDIDENGQVTFDSETQSLPTSSPEAIPAMPIKATSGGGEQAA